MPLKGNQLSLLAPPPQPLTTAKLITLHQPWASLVATGLKRHETRHWKTDYRGPLLIHAAALRMKPASQAVLEEACCLMNRGIPENLPYGAIVAIADLTDCRMMADKYNTLTEQTYAYIHSQTPLERMVGNWSAGRYAFRLDNVRPLQPIPMKSRQGKLLDVSPEILTLVNQQLLEAR